MTTTASPAIEYWARKFGQQRAYLALFAGNRTAGKRDLTDTVSEYYAWPTAAVNAVRWLEEKSAEGMEVYACAHLVTDRRRIKANTAPITAG